MDFMHDQLGDDCSFRTFNVIDGYNCEAIGIEIDFSLPTEKVIRALDQIIECHGKSVNIRSDNGPENVSSQLAVWAEKRGVVLKFIQPGKSQ